MVREVGLIWSGSPRLYNLLISCVSVWEAGYELSLIFLQLVTWQAGL